jgi:hypothetical protein
MAWWHSLFLGALFFVIVRGIMFGVTKNVTAQRAVAVSIAFVIGVLGVPLTLNGDESTLYKVVCLGSSVLGTALAFGVELSGIFRTAPRRPPGPPPPPG